MKVWAIAAAWIMRRALPADVSGSKALAISRTHQKKAPHGAIVRLFVAWCVLARWCTIHVACSLAFAAQLAAGDGGVLPGVFALCQPPRGDTSLAMRRVGGAAGLARTVARCRVCAH